MRTWFVGVAAGLLIGLTSGIAVGGGGFTDAAWGFLGVIVGAGTTIAVEEARAARHRRQKIGEWKLAKLDQISVDIADVERVYKHALMWQIENLTSKKILPPSYRNPHLLDLESTINLLRISSGVMLDNEIPRLANAYWAATYETIDFEPDYADRGNPLDDATLDRLLDDHNELTRNRTETLEAIRTVVAVAITSALDET